jgi:hypothetical protein
LVKIKFPKRVSSLTMQPDNEPTCPALRRKIQHYRDNDTAKWTNAFACVRPEGIPVTKAIAARCEHHAKTLHSAKNGWTPMRSLSPFCLCTGMFYNSHVLPRWRRDNGRGPHDIPGIEDRESTANAALEWFSENKPQLGGHPSYRMVFSGRMDF